MESLTDCGCSEMDNGTKDCRFLQGIKGTEFDVVQAQPEKYGTGFDAAVSYLGQWSQRMALQCNPENMKSASEA